MQAVPVETIASQSISNTLATYYTSPANKKTIISKLVFCNTGSKAEKIDVHLVVSGGSASAANKVISGKTIDAGETWPAYMLEGVALPPGTFLQAKSDTASSAITITGSGVEVY